MADMLHKLKFEVAWDRNYNQRYHHQRCLRNLS